MSHFWHSTLAVRRCILVAVSNRLDNKLALCGYNLCVVRNICDQSHGVSWQLVVGSWQSAVGQVQRPQPTAIAPIHRAELPYRMPTLCSCLIIYLLIGCQMICKHFTTLSGLSILFLN